MALSGTLDTFSLPDVLRLLASTAKTGRLRITGDRGSGSVWLDSGEVVATELASAVSHDPTDAEVVFGLLRFSAGSFTFETDARAPHAASPEAMEPILGAAENMLVEWRSIEEVIPSLDVWVGLRPTLDGPDVMVDRSRWKGIAAIGSGAQVGAVAEVLQLNEIDSCRLVKELLELGLVDFIDEPAGLPAAASFEPEPVEMVEPTPSFDEAPLGVDEGVDPIVDDETDGAAPEPGGPEALLEELDALDASPALADDEPSGNGIEPSLAALASSDDYPDTAVFSQGGIETGDDDLFAGSAPGGDDELDPAEMARAARQPQPQGREGRRAAAKATTTAERDAALAAVEAEDESVNRGLLLKFLGSVDS
ncbi:MAG: DUF4388 domain-containing protein [Acidimicrobiales bacterium]